MDILLQQEEKILTKVLKLKMDMQYAVQSAMKKRGISQKQLAKRMDCSPSNISQILSDDANPRIESIAKALVVMDEEFAFISESMHGGWLLSNYKEVDELLIETQKFKIRNEHNPSFFIENLSPQKMFKKPQINRANDNGWLKNNKSFEFSEKIKPIAA